VSALRTCDDLRPLLGGYVLGGLEPDETEAVRDHLPRCPACAAELASLAGLPALLDVAASMDRPEEPLSPGIEEALLDRFARERQPRRRRRPRLSWTRPRVAIASAVAAAALTAVGMAAVLRDPAPAPSRNFVLRLTAAPGEPAARARVALYRVGGGTGAHLWVNGLRPGARRVYEVLCDGNGWSASAGTFRADARGHAEVRLTTAARVGEYKRIRIVYRTDGRQMREVLTGRLF